MAEEEAVRRGPRPVHEVPRWRMPLIWGAAKLVRLWCRTLRVSYDHAALAELARDPRPVALMLWHNRLFMVPWLAGAAWPGRPVHALVSASRDGANFAQLLQFIGLRAVRGSSSRFGREALHELIAVLRAGGDIAITPDGPRGPLYQMKAGAVLAARRARAPLLLLGIQFVGAWRARSWDRFCIPRPFSRVVLRHELIEPESVAGGMAGVAALRTRLLQLSGEDPAAWPADVGGREQHTEG